MTTAPADSSEAVAREASAGRRPKPWLWVALAVTLALGGFATRQLLRSGTDPASLSQAYGFDIGDFPAIADEGSDPAPALEGLERFPAWRLLATDYDAEMIELCEERLPRFGDRVEVRQADATKLEMPDASVDLVVSIFVWHHVEEWTRATAECARVLRPGGRLLLVDFVSARQPTVVTRLFPPMSRYRMREVRSALRDAGFARWRATTTAGLVFRLVAENRSEDGFQAVRSSVPNVERAS